MSSSTPLPDSSLYDGEARNDFWTISCNFVQRHQVEPRVKLYVSREALFHTPLKYIDVTRATSTSLDVMLEKISTIIGTWMEIENCHIRGQVSLGSRNWLKKPPDGYTWSRVETDKEANDIQARLRVARNLESYVGSVETQSKAKVGYRKTED